MEDGRATLDERDAQVIGHHVARALIGLRLAGVRQRICDVSAHAQVDRHWRRGAEIDVVARIRFAGPIGVFGENVERFEGFHVEVGVNHVAVHADDVAHRNDVLLGEQHTMTYDKLVNSVRVRVIGHAGQLAKVPVRSHHVRANPDFHI